MIRVRGLTKRFPGGGQPVLDGVDFDAAEGELVCVIGPSGSGKSTLLRCLAGLERFDAGSVSIREAAIAGGERGDAASLRKLRAMTGMVFQQFHLFPHLTAIGNVALAPRVVRRLSAAASRAAAERFLGLVGLGDLGDRFPGELSGGQQQRVAIARSLAMDPAVLLYDEPTSALDPALRGEVLDVMRRLDERGVTQIVVTHEMAFARRAADRVAYFEAGRVVESGPPEAVFGSPRDERTRRFVSR